MTFLQPRILFGSGLRRPASRVSVLTMTILAATLTTSSPVAAVNYVWEPPVQITQTPSGGGALAKGIKFAVGSEEKLHMVAQQWPSTGDNLHATGYYYDFDGTTWSDSTRFTLVGVNHADSARTTDFRFVVDEEDSVHVVFEVHKYPNFPVALGIGYKWQGDSTWAASMDPHLISAAGGRSPRMALEQRASAADVLHVLWQSGNNEMMHSSRIVDTSAHWTTPHLITDKVRPSGVVGRFVFAGDGKIHFFKSVSEANQAGGHDHKLLYLIEDPYNWSTNPDPVTLDTFSTPSGEGKLDEDEQEPEIGLVQNADEVLLTWSHYNSSASEWEARYNVLDTTDSTWTWNTPFGTILSPEDGVDSKARGAIKAVDDDTIHVLWAEQDRVALVHTFLCDTCSTWSEPARFSPDTPTDLRRVGKRAVGDTLITVWTQEAENSSGIERQSWYRRGYPSPADSVADSTTATWEGVVFLDGDFKVPETAKLVINPGTVVVAANGHDRTQLGEYADRVELVVEGQLEAKGTVDSTIEFHSVQQGADSWYGIRFDLLPESVGMGYGYIAAAEPLSEISNATIADGAVGIQIDGQVAPNLSAVSFERIASSNGLQCDIVIDSTDVIIPWGYMDGST